MIRNILLLLLSFIGCAGPSSIVLLNIPQKSYAEFQQEFKSCRGKGMIESTGPIKGKFFFAYKSQNDSTFLEFNDLIGRKAFLMWITPNFVTARNLIENKQYKYNQVLEFFPILKIIEPNDITKIIWGVEPNYKVKLKNVHASISKNIELDFIRNKMGNESQDLVGAKFYNKDSGQGYIIDIQTRNRNDNYINMKKVWRLLKY